MSVAARLGWFMLALAVVFAGAYGVGAVAGPATDPDVGHDRPVGHAQPGGHSESGREATGPGGLAVAADGYALRPVSGAPTAGQPGEFAFEILNGQQRPVTGVQVSHEQRLHLIVVRRDLTGFQHLHPQLDDAGTWRVPLTLPAAGTWRVFADFRPDGHDRQVILGVDVQVAGAYEPQILPEPTESTTVDGYAVDVAGRLTAGQTSRLTMAIAKDAQPVADLQPYLGAYGHLVVLRAGDLAYLHVHPERSDTAGPEVTFDVEVPTPGAYRMFLDFQHGGVVRTASVTAAA